MDDKIPKALLDSIAKADLHKPDHASLVLDFSGIPAADSRTVFCSFVRYIESSEIDGLTAKLLSNNTASLMFPVVVRREVEGFIKRLNDFLLLRRYGKIDVRYFNLDGNAQEFAQCCSQYLLRGSRASAEAFREFYQQPPSGLDQLAELIDLERIVGQADMSMHLRRQHIWKLAKNRKPVILGEELWVSIAAMEEITGKHIIQDTWMFSRFTELLDNRVLSHLSVDQTLWEKQLFVNLNPVAIVSDNFHKVIKSLPYQRLEKLTVEMGLTSWQQNSSRSKSILEDFNREGIGLALDGISVSKLSDLPENDAGVSQFLKVHVSPLEGTDLHDALAKLPPEMMEKIICTRCETVEQIEIAVKAGVQYFQGYGLRDFVSAPEVVESILGAVEDAEVPEDDEVEAGDKQ
ncbi:hypothetical protein ACQ0MK_01015 [Thalassospira lucentensis]|uniref:hypothetical protein n=1 Tax=Thalassospira lucentensis TaxID=168935 RepID=UPI003D2ECEEA